MRLYFKGTVDEEPGHDQQWPVPPLWGPVLQGGHQQDQGPAQDQEMVPLQVNHWLILIDTPGGHHQDQGPAQGQEMVSLQVNRWFRILFKKTWLADFLTQKMYLIY